MTALLVVAGIAGSMLSARVLARNDREKTHSAFTSSAAEVASRLRLAVQHEEDLVVGARAFIVGNPIVSQSAFLRWTTVVGALARYPELEGGGEVVVVPASQLAAFAARQTADPASPLPADGSFQVLPPGRRPYYCLLALTFARTAQINALPAGYDYCSAKAELRSAFLAARDSGQNAYLPYRSGLKTELLIDAPVYRGGAVPKTIAGRRREFLGAFATAVNPTILMNAALQGHAGIAVEFHYDRVSHVVFRSGVAARGAQTVTIDLHYGWTMQAFGPAQGGGTLADGRAMALLGAGVALSLLLGLLVLVLGTGRAHALAMVREKTRELSEQALHDTLTGLPNRTLVLDRAERMLARARREPSVVPAALFVDVDRFKHVNDSFGHAAGDRLLKIVGERLRGVVRDQDTVGRLGGDEFVVLLESATGETPPDVVAERVIEAMREPVLLDDDETTYFFSVSVGIAIGRRATAEELLRDSDLALYTAKAAGKDRAVLFQASMQRAMKDRIELEAQLDDALKGEQFFLLYQPIFDLHSQQMVGVEALIRWRHPERGTVEPDDFIALAEETGRIVPIGRWVLEEACRQAAAWEAQGHRIGMSVNISAHQLDRDGFAEDVRRALHASGIEPSSLTLEIAETALMRDVPAASNRLREIKALGVRVAIDDFGTGSSSLAHLHQFPADALKIDRAFIAGIAASSESAAIIHTLVALGKLLDIETLAEGIEEPDQLTELQHEQCDQGQGFLLARPLDVNGVERLLQSSEADSRTTTIT
jgi:diguanylate cyclase (GGDEF)-like protein